ncbi:DUF1330 domain-containing protein [Leptospira vanthielii]|uniref:DUF1330 domain-containing protein n=2 Tax=Leptospira vanthielii TaxID=293085 RepID=A0ABY2NSB5_9LEPT|nr:DUF1330 domain-containing protein [Leptospira vanthielii]EMY70934.1 hypothetical protein LEP1GSC199_0319 [Leptospira vanthielii serovar Holland str. Waz Holland = ATCC 700522]TGM60473.1 DUF1330 domain-containing protein [Leptospira vanthielii]
MINQIEKKEFAYETVVGLKVSDDELYTNYRKAMTPLLIKYEGGFRYDFKIQETLISEDPKPINRLFLIFFKNKELKDLFFKDPEYLKIRETFFTPSVESTTILSEYERYQ